MAVLFDDSAKMSFLGQKVHHWQGNLDDGGVRVTCGQEGHLITVPSRLVAEHMFVPEALCRECFPAKERA